MADDPIFLVAKQGFGWNVRALSIANLQSVSIASLQLVKSKALKKPEESTNFNNSWFGSRGSEVQILFWFLGCSNVVDFIDGESH